MDRDMTIDLKDEKYQEEDEVAIIIVIKPKSAIF